MTADKSEVNEGMLKEPSDFSFVLGGPLYQLLRRAHLSGDALELMHRRIIFFPLFAWLPLLVLSALDGQLFRGSAAVPFLMDVEVHVRFLVALPLLLAAELVVYKRTRFVVTQFLTRHLIPESAMTRFNAAIASASKLRNSMRAELLLVALVYVVGVLFTRRMHANFNTLTWYSAPTDHGMKLLPAGVWYAFISMPFFQFLLLRWYFRLFIWTRFLWQVSRLDLSLVPTHPDRVGGLGFLSETVYAFMPLATAQGALLAGAIASRIFLQKAALLDFKVEIVVMVVFLMCVVLGPLFLFASQLAETRRTGNYEYGTLAERYVREFDTKWLRGGASADESLLGSGDIQSLADMSNSFEVLRTMSIAPLTKESVIGLAAAILAPVAPLILTMMSWEQLLKTLFGILF